MKGAEAAAAVAAAAEQRRAAQPDEPEDKSVQRVQRKLASMLDKLELDIQVLLLSPYLARYICCALNQ